LNFQGCLGRNANANHLSLFAHKSQIPLAFVSRESNGRDAFTGGPRHLRLPADWLIVEFFGLARLVSGPGLAVVTATAPSNPRG
jgi:hypothetical protein